jgi:acyl-coenzyme A thioesterase PaaI-like protein
VAQLVGFTLAAVAEGRSSAVLEAGPQHANPMGTRHGDRLRQYPS